MLSAIFRLDWFKNGNILAHVIAAYHLCEAFHPTRRSSCVFRFFNGELHSRIVLLSRGIGECASSCALLFIDGCIAIGVVFSFTSVAIVASYILALKERLGFIMEWVPFLEGPIQYLKLKKVDDAQDCSWKIG